MDDIASRLGKIALIGGGKMGEAILAGLIHGALFNPATIEVANPGEEKRRHLSETYGVTCVEDGAQIKLPTTVILAVKPQKLRAVAEHLAATSGFLPQRVVSIAAGITTQTLATFFPHAAVIRVMPNTGLTVGAGMSVISVAQGTPRAEGELVSELFSLMGEALLVDESLQNAATAISGSGPAYFALFVKELAAAGTRAGLPADAALLLARQTMLGTSRYLELTSQSPEQLMAAVTSPNGTTQAALEAFEAAGITSTIQAAVTAAITRAEELA